MKQRRRGFASLPIVWMAFVALTGVAMAQGTPVEPEKTSETPGFEVATIKPHPAGDMTIYMGGPTSTFAAKNVTAKILIEQAFHLPADQVVGGPAWADSQHFDVTAKIPDAEWQRISTLHFRQQEEVLESMLQALLKERFQLAITHKPKELTVYALTVAKGGSKLHVAGTEKPPQLPEGARFMMGMDQKDITVSTLADFLSGHFRRTVLDRTGLEGRYDISLYVGIPEENSPDAADTAIFRALEDQLGLKLVSRKEMVDTISIEHLELPSEN